MWSIHSFCIHPPLCGKKLFNSSKFNKDVFLFRNKVEVVWRCESIAGAGHYSRRSGKLAVWLSKCVSPSHVACGSFGDKAPRRYTHRWVSGCRRAPLFVLLTSLPTRKQCTRPSRRTGNSCPTPTTSMCVHRRPHNFWRRVRRERRLTAEGSC